MSAEAVETGEYHSRSAFYAGHWLHRWYLRRAYEATYDLVRQLGRDPLSLPAPRVLLCGTGSAQTTHTFVTFIRERAPNALITVLDLNAIPLESSREQLSRICISNIRFVRANALKMPFEAASFDLIETDFFLQFFSNETKPRLIREWARVFDSRAGAIMTRDYVRTASRRLSTEALLDTGRQALFRRTLRSETHATTESALTELFALHQLQASFQSVAFGWARLPVVKLIAARSVHS